MSDIIENLESLSPEELEKVANLINKFAKRKEDDGRQQKKRKRKKKRVDDNDAELIVEEQVGRKKPRKRILLDENDEVERPKTRGRGRTQPRRQSARRKKQNYRGNKGRSKGVMAKTESVQLSGENRFMKMKERYSNKKDSVIDKKLWENREVSARPDEYEPIEVQCKECELWYDVNPATVLMDRDSGDYNYTCNNCVRR